MKFYAVYNVYYSIEILLRILRCIWRRYTIYLLFLREG